MTGEPAPEEKTFSQAEIDEINAKHQEEINSLSERLKSEYKRKADGEIKAAKAKMEEEVKRAGMSELEKANAELEDYKNKYQEEADKNALSIQKDDLRKYMTEKEVNNTFLDFLIVPKDLDKSKVNVDNFKSVFDEAVQKAVEAKIPSHVPNTNGTTKASGIKKDIPQKPWNRFK